MVESMSGTTVVTGAAGDMGLACARRFAAHGDRLVLTDRDEPGLERAAEALARADVATVACDITDRGAVEALAAAAAAHGPLGAVVHAAGISTAMGDWRDLVKINFVGTWHVLTAFEPHVVAGSVAVCFSSMAGTFLHAAGRDVDDAFLDDPGAPRLLDELEQVEDGFYCGREWAYRWSKLGVAKLCERHAAPWGQRGGRVVSVSPGLIKGRMQTLELAPLGDLIEKLDAVTPLGRMGEPDEVAEVVDLLASPACSFVSGCDLRVDGGLASQRRLLFSRAAG